MKSLILLTTALFLVSAPSPDSKSISEISAGFLIETKDVGLMASEADTFTGIQTAEVNRRPAEGTDPAEAPRSPAEPVNMVLAEQLPAQCLVKQENC